MARDFSNFNSEEFKDVPVPDFSDGSLDFPEFLRQREAIGIDPLSPEALKLQAQYVQGLDSSKHPLDILRNIANNRKLMPKDRIAACKAIMEYSMVRVPAKLEIDGEPGNPVKLSQEQLSSLSMGELDTLIKLLDKMGAK